jgi:hypothetical protein
VSRRYDGRWVAVLAAHGRGHRAGACGRGTLVTHVVRHLPPWVRESSDCGHATRKATVMPAFAALSVAAAGVSTLANVDRVCVAPVARDGLDGELALFVGWRHHYGQDGAVRPDF